MSAYFIYAYFIDWFCVFSYGQGKVSEGHILWKCIATLSCNYPVRFAKNGIC